LKEWQLIRKWQFGVLDYSCLQEPFFLLVWHSESISKDNNMGC